MTLEEGCSVKPGLRFRQMLNRKEGRNFGAVSAGSHRFCISSVPDTQTERIEHDRLTCPSLAGNTGHASMQLDIEALNNGVIADGEICEHDDRFLLDDRVLLTVPCYVSR